MEEVLDLYQRPYDPTRPLLCMDEHPVQLVGETRQPIPACEGQPRRVDYEYERHGTASLFLFTEPLASWRSASARPRRTKLDWAEELRRVLDERYKEAEKVLLVVDNLNTHTLGALYDAFLPEEARRLARKIEIHYTPKHGSWLNVAECELSVFARQGLSERVPNLETLQSKAAAWTEHRNRAQRYVDWQFTTADARIKLKRLYPRFQE